MGAGCVRCEFDKVLGIHRGLRYLESPILRNQVVQNALRDGGGDVQAAVAGAELLLWVIEAVQGLLAKVGLPTVMAGHATQLLN